MPSETHRQRDADVSPLKRTCLFLMLTFEYLYPYKLWWRDIGESTCHIVIRLC